MLPNSKGDNVNGNHLKLDNMVALTSVEGHLAKSLKI